ncbi:hypothetical protein CLV51_1021102 [Chitinophaga niastensis]|uniref:Terpene synthase n=1 Tax=Chitinophaga niastensis TaxID=536980 RepID=A0A2P8HPW2_CHINA|nr:terpene synthase family protein [Chitinophaga niastensis]PSL48237.1 hypothetical protein CLV51_1021102 [Chitinophaga niastensis]
MKQNVQRTAHAKMQKIQKEYAAVMAEGKTCFSLLQLFNHDEFRLEEYCRSFKKHPFASSLAEAARSFGTDYNIWIDNAEHYITCAIFLFPTAGLDRMLPIVKNLAIDYYLNDTMGREVFDKLTLPQRESAEKVISRMGSEMVLSASIEGLEPIEIANREVLEYMKNTSTQAWFDEFLQLYAYHIKVTHRNCNAAEMGHVPSISEYTESRCHMAGMHHVISLIDYSEGQFIDQEWLIRIGAALKLKRLQYVTAAIGGLMNDLFSFEKEIIDNSADSNLVMVIALNNPFIALTEVLLQACGIVQDLLREFISLLKDVRELCDIAVVIDEDMAQQLHKHLDGLERCVQASWVWQVHTLRYKRPNSIWAETQLKEVMRRAV